MKIRYATREEIALGQLPYEEGSIVLLKDDTAEMVVSTQGQLTQSTEVKSFDRGLNTTGFLFPEDWVQFTDKNELILEDGEAFISSPNGLVPLNSEIIDRQDEDRWLVRFGLYKKRVVLFSKADRNDNISSISPPIITQIKMNLESGQIENIFYTNSTLWKLSSGEISIENNEVLISSSFVFSSENINIDFDFGVNGVLGDTPSKVFNNFRQKYDLILFKEVDEGILPTDRPGSLLYDFPTSQLIFLEANALNDWSTTYIEPAEGKETYAIAVALTSNVVPSIIDADSPQWTPPVLTDPRARDGEQGPPGEPGDDGLDAASVRIITSSAGFKKRDNVFIPETITLSFSTENISSITSTIWEKGGVQAGTNNTLVITGSTDFASVETNTYKIIVTGTINGIENSSRESEIILNRFDEEPGAPGADAASVVITTSAASFKRDRSGTVTPSSIILSTTVNNITGTPNLTYVWKKGNDIVGGDNSEYSVPSTDFSGTTVTNTYSVQVTGIINGQTASRTANIVINRIDDGPLGPTAVFKGTWESGKNYIFSENQTDVVFYQGFEIELNDTIQNLNETQEAKDLYTFLFNGGTPFLFKGDFGFGIEDLEFGIQNQIIGISSIESGANISLNSDGLFSGLDGQSIELLNSYQIIFTEEEVLKETGNYYILNSGSTDNNLNPDLATWWEPFTFFQYIASELSITEESIVRNNISIGDNAEIIISATPNDPPFLSIGQVDEDEENERKLGYNDKGIFLGIHNFVTGEEPNQQIEPRPSLALRSLTDTDNFLEWDGNSLRIKGDLEVFSPVSFFNVDTPSFLRFSNPERTYGPNETVPTIEEVKLTFEIINPAGSTPELEISFAVTQDNVPLDPSPAKVKVGLNFEGITAMQPDGSFETVRVYIIHPSPISISFNGFSIFVRGDYRPQAEWEASEVIINISNTENITESLQLLSNQYSAGEFGVSSVNGRSGDVILGIEDTLTSNVNPHLVLAGPTGTESDTPTFRALVPADIPILNQSTTGTAANVTGVVAIGNGGTGANTAAGARDNLGLSAAGANREIQFNNNGAFGANSNLKLNTSNELELQGNLRFIGPQTIVPNSVTEGSDAAGNAITIRSGLGRGSGDASFLVQTPNAVAANNNQSSFSSRLRINRSQFTVRDVDLINLQQTTIITGDLNFSNAASRVISIADRAGDGRALTIRAGGSSLGTNHSGGSLILSSGTSRGNDDSVILFQTANFGDLSNTPTTKMVIVGNGNVGIGTTAPSEKLHVVGKIRMTGAVDGDEIVATKKYVDDNIGGGGTVASVGSGDGLTGGPITTIGTLAVDSTVLRTNSNATFTNAANRVILIANRPNDHGRALTVRAGGSSSGTNQFGGSLILSSGTSRGTGNSIIQFQTAGSGNTSNAPTTKMTILGNGNVGIGTESPNSLLHVNGTFQANSITETSTRTLKTNIQPLQINSNDISKLNPVRFDWIDPEKPKNQIGLIAEEVYEIFPDLVTLDEEGNIQGVQYSKLTLHLLETVKKLQKEIQELKNKEN